MTTHYFLDRITGPDPNLRAGDADRERIADRLRTSHAEGRIDLSEFQQRLERCYEAKTLGELRELVSDLPRPEQQPQRRSVGWSRPWWALASLAPIVIALIVISAATGHDHASWLWIPAAFLVWRMVWWRRRRWFAQARRGPDDWL
jgi:Flp pilus assembly protein TadB